MESKNSMLHEVQALYDAIYRDLIALHPSISIDIERDSSRLRNAAVSVGLPFYTMTLPAGAKWFDKSLSAGRLIEPRPPHFGVKGKGDVRPKLLFGLMSQIFEPDGTLRSVVEVSYVASVRQVLLAAKKLRMDCEERYKNESVLDFHKIERSLPRPREQTWDHDDPRWSNLSGHPIWGDHSEFDGQTHMFDTPDALLQLDFEPDWEGFRRFSAGVLHQLGQFHPYQVRAKHGPGAVSDREKSYVKYDFKYWTERLEAVFPYDWHASTDLSVPDYVKYREFASQMHAVPKTQSGPRLIAAEPIAHQWIQQGIREWLESRVKCSILGNSIDFRSQQMSRDAALDASRTGLSATVDLSSASDRLSCRLVDYVFQSRPDILDALHACRTRAMIDTDGELILLRKYSTQGSAVIFPMQSVIYSMLAIWAVMLKYNRKDFSYAKWASLQVRVFGDDIIIPTDVYPVLAGLLKTCLLKVNESKSHNTGFFRESCGMDAYAGVDVTPAYFRAAYDATPDALVSVIECSNNFHKKGLWHTALHLLTTVPPSERKLLAVGVGIGSVSLFSFCGEAMDHLVKRWNPKLHREERRALDVTIKVPKRVGDGNGSLNQYLFEVPDPLLPYKAGEVTRPRSRKTTRWVHR